ncbi:hypothetical protein N2603_20345 [Bradyrhizobium huanghuaihaiense]|uniref:AbiU2 domain-containing protein n=1 Tax=Bradyrhizobium huanghuaihaiense TaxID=990078 RepID=UPI0021AA601A|nr:hypothetical protein [Bradyrhizobium sp. CB3035]UWU80726.1 hypothetical protein N2603_20345 [Bradyrhizobium sp. CB3035]
MTFRTAEEAKTANVAKMGDELGEIYSALWQDVAVLHFDWHEYVELFGTKPARIDLMNAAASHFFRLVQDRLWETTLLHLARLTDPAESMGKGSGRTNLTIRALSGLIDDAPLKDRLAKLADEAVKLTEFARDWRNRHIAHRDLKLALEQATTPLAEASREDVKKALSAIAAVLNEAATHYTDSQTAFEHVAGPLGGAVSLLYVLGIGERAKEERGKRLRAGIQTAEDLVIHDV